MAARVCIIAFPWRSNNPYDFLSEVIQIISNISSEIIIITGNAKKIKYDNNKNIRISDVGISAHYLNEINPRPYSIFLWLIKNIIIQIKQSYRILKMRYDFDVVIYYMAYPYFILPLITSKILGKKNIEILTRGKRQSLIERIISVQDHIILRLLDGIAPESSGLVSELRLEKYEKKILPIGARYIDGSKFTIRKEFEKRNLVIGYIGRMFQSKGILEFIDSIPFVIRELPSATFMIIGEGALLSLVKEKCSFIEKQTGARIEIIGYVKRDRISFFLNEMKLLVLPSRSEGLPTIILEAMACGTPVLITQSCAIADYVKDGYTGFILSDTSPKAISNDIIRAIRNPNLKSIVENAKNIIDNLFSYQSAIDRWKKIIDLQFDKK